MTAATATAGTAARTARPRLLYFFDPHDGQGRRIESFLAQVLQHRRNHDTFLTTRIDLVERPDLASRFRIVNPPTLLVVADRRVRARLEQPRGVQQIEDAPRPWLH